MSTLFDVTGGACSFAGDTLVNTSEGYRAISQLQIGDLVWSRHAESGEQSYKPVLARYSNEYAETVYVTIVDSETGKEQIIVSNRIHPFFVTLPEDVSEVNSSEGHIYKGEIKNGAWVDAEHLQPGYRLLNDDRNWAEVVGISVRAVALTAYNLTVSDYSTYFVTGDAETEAVWVHNTCLGKLNENPEVLKKLKDISDDDLALLRGDLKDLQATNDSNLFNLLNNNVDNLDSWLLLKNSAKGVRQNSDVIEQLAKLSAKKMPDGTPLDVAKLLDNGLGNTLSKVADADKKKILARLSEWDASKLDDLARRLGKDKYPGLDEDLADPRFFKLYDEIIHGDPGNAFDIAKRLDSKNLLTSAKSTFFNDVTKLGKKFEEETVLNALKQRSSNADYLKLQKELSKNLDEYDMYSQLQLGFDPVKLPNGKTVDYFIADQVFVKWGRDATNTVDIIVDIVIIENKLKNTTVLTANQIAGMASSKLTVRSLNPKLVSEGPSRQVGKKLTQESSIDIKADWVKVSDSDKGDIITGVKQISFGANKINNPLDDPKVAKQIFEDPSAIYGYAPKQGKGLDKFGIDFSDASQVASARAKRIAYLRDLEKKKVALSDEVKQLQAEGLSMEKIARLKVEQRNQGRIDSYIRDNNMGGLKSMQERNLVEYGRKEGPTADQLFETKGSWENVIFGSVKSSRAMDVLLGLD